MAGFSLDMAINRTNIGRQLVGDLGGFVGRDVSTQFMRKPKKLYAEGATVETESEELITKTFPNGKTWTWNPQKESEPDPETGRTRKFDPSTGVLFETGKKISEQVGGIGGANLFGQAKFVKPEEGEKIPEKKRKKREFEDRWTSADEETAGFPTGKPSYGFLEEIDPLGLAIAGTLADRIPFAGRGITQSMIDSEREKASEAGKGSGVPRVWDEDQLGIPTIGENRGIKSGEAAQLSRADYNALGPEAKAMLREEYGVYPEGKGFLQRTGELAVPAVMAAYGPGGLSSWKDRMEADAMAYALAGTKKGDAIMKAGHGDWRNLTPDQKEIAEKSVYQTKRSDFTPVKMVGGDAFSFSPSGNEWLDEWGVNSRGFQGGSWISTKDGGYYEGALANPNHPRYEEWKAGKQQYKREQLGIKEPEPEPESEKKIDKGVVEKIGKAAKGWLDNFILGQKQTDFISGPDTWTPGAGSAPSGVEDEPSPELGTLDSIAADTALTGAPSYGWLEMGDDRGMQPESAWGIDTYGGWEHIGEGGEAPVASGGAIPFAHGGGLSSLADKNLAPGSFVLSADVISGVGDGSSESGLRRLNTELGFPVTPNGVEGRALGGTISGTVRGPGTGLDDLNQTTIAGKQAAALANQEVVVSPGSVTRLAQMLYPDKKLSPQEALKTGQEALYNFQKNIRKQKADSSKGGKQPGPLKTGKGGLRDLMMAG